MSPELQARVASVLYVLVIVLGGYAEPVGRQGLVVAGDAAATAHTIIAHQGDFRLGCAAKMMTNVVAIPATLIIYRLLPLVWQRPHPIWRLLIGYG